MQFQQGKPPLGIILDSAMGNSIDGALALALMFGFDGKNEARVISMSVTRSNLSSAAFCEAVGRFYAGAVNGAFGAVGRSLPVGLADDGKMKDETPMITVPLSKMNPEGKPVYASGIQKLNDTAEVSALIRNAFTSQQDQNCVAVLAGPATNFVRTLPLPGVKDLVAKKCRYMVFAGGNFPDGPAEFNIKADIPAARKLFAEWPTPIIMAGLEVGNAIPFPAASIEKDFAWSPAHPVVDAYKAAHPMPYDAPTWSMAAILYAVHPEGYFKLSEPGTITVLDDGRTKFTPSAQGKHRYLIVDPEQKEKVLKTYTELASAKPVVRAPRFRPNQQQQQKDKDAKDKELKEKEIPVDLPAAAKPPA